MTVSDSSTVKPHSRPPVNRGAGRTQPVRSEENVRIKGSRIKQRTYKHVKDDSDDTLSPSKINGGRLL